MRSLRERMMIAAGSVGPALGPSGCEIATYSSLPMVMRLTPCPESSGVSASAESDPSVDARTTPPIANAMSAPVNALNCAAR